VDVAGIVYPQYWLQVDVGCDISLTSWSVEEILL
jgi:hypothetical protein